MKKTYQTPHISVILVEDHAHVNMSTPYCAAKNNTTVGPNACAVAPGVPNLNVIQPTPPGGTDQQTVGSTLCVGFANGDVTAACTQGTTAENCFLDS